jgi:hypothetical protein
MADYSVDYNDQRFKAVETEKQNKLNEANSMYNNMIANTDNRYNEMIQASKNYANEQIKNQQARTDFAIDEINQQKDQTKKDYTREQMGAYTDWQKQSNQYGANAEKLASSGLTNSGYSESSQVSMYNTYQNRIMQAKESYNQAVQNYNNKITEARLSNNEALAQIAYNALQSQLQLALEGFQYKNGLLQQQLSTQMSIDSDYYGRYQNVLAQINHENQFKYQQERDRIADQQWQKQYNLQLANSRKSSSGSSSKKSSSTSSSNQQVNTEQKATPTPKEIIDNIKMLQGPGLTNNIKDGISGKTFSSIDALLNYYGYASTSK